MIETETKAPYSRNARAIAPELIHRDRTGEGQHVEASLLSTALAVFNSHLIEQGVLSIDRQPTGNRVQTSAPSDVFATRDGHILTHTVGGGLYRRWAELMGEAEWRDDVRFGSDQSRGDQRDVICERMQRWCSERTTEEALDELRATGIPCGKVLDLHQALDNPQVALLNAG